MRFHYSRAVPLLTLLSLLVPFTTFGAYTQVTTFAGGGGVFSQPTVSPSLRPAI